MLKKILIISLVLYALGFAISLFVPESEESISPPEKVTVAGTASQSKSTMSIFNLIEGGRSFVEQIYGNPTKEQAYTGSYCRKKCTKYFYGDGIELIMEGNTVINFSVFDRKPTCKFSVFDVPEYFGLEVRPDFHVNGQMRWDDYIGYKIGVFDTGGDINFNIVKGDR